MRTGTVLGCQQAIERDPSFALPYAGLAETYSLIDHAVGEPIMDDDEAYEKAIALEPNNQLIKQNFDLFKELNDRAAQKDGGQP